MSSDGYGQLNISTYYEALMCQPLCKVRCWGWLCWEASQVGNWSQAGDVYCILLDAQGENITMGKLRAICDRGSVIDGSPSLMASLFFADM